MRLKDIVIGEYYRLKSNPNYGYIKPIGILQPKQYPNENSYIVVECEHIVRLGDITGFIRYFKPVDIIKI